MIISKEKRFGCFKYYIRLITSELILLKIVKLRGGGREVGVQRAQIMSFLKVYNISASQIYFRITGNT